MRRACARQIAAGGFVGDVYAGPDACPGELSSAGTAGDKDALIEFIGSGRQPTYTYARSRLARAGKALEGAAQ